MKKEQFTKWLQQNNILSISTYNSRLEKVEEAEGDLDLHFNKDKGASLLRKFNYTTADRNNEKLPKHQITIQPGDENNRFQSYYEGTNDYKSRITKYMEFREALEKDEEPIGIIEKVKSTYEKMQLNNGFLSLKELNEGYTRFSEKFSPAILKGLDGEQLLNTFLNIGNRDGMTYWLEFKNDDEFKTSAKSYGGISGGSSYKYILFNRNSDNQWVTGNPQSPTVLTLDEAIQLAREVRDSLLDGAELINQLPQQANIQDYMQLQAQLENRLNHNMHNLGWVHKYYHMIFPTKVENFHSTTWQRHLLMSVRILPIQDDKLYTMTGQLMQIVHETTLPTANVMLTMIELFGAPVNHFKIEISDEKPTYWQDMLSESYIAIGYSKVGDLSVYSKAPIIRVEVAKALVTHYQFAPNLASQKAREIYRFSKYIKIGDIVLAAKGQNILGIGRITGEYEYIEDRPFAHCKSVEWIRVFENPVTLPNSADAKLLTCANYRDLNNIFEIKRLIIEETPSSKKIVTPTMTPLKGVQADIQSILKRKKQVILYGPPGTGKTYHAENTCYELSARNLFKKSFDSLTSKEKATIKGDGRQTGTVRMCCFHPSYGYEDFIEGIKPSVVNEQTVFELRNGIFKDICDDAEQHPEKNFYLLIDEINRGDISRIFGELIMLIESGKRGKALTLALSNSLFSVPPNVFIVGTMNTADRSIALLDVALRRRFGFIELLTDYHMLEGVIFNGLPLDGWLKEVNQRIRDHIGNEARNLQIGHSYFLEKERVIDDQEKFKRIIKEDIIPLIEEYCYSDYTLIEKILGDGIVDVKKQQIKSELFETADSTDLIAALLSKNPALRIDLVVEEEEEEQEQEEQEE